MSRHARNFLMDRLDRKILFELQRDASLSMATLSERIGLSLSACHRRVKLLEAAGVIEGYMARLDRHGLGLEMQVFLESKLASPSKAQLTAFEAAVQAMDEVLECHLISGDFDYLIRVAATGTTDYERLYRERICLLPGIAQTRTLLSMSTVKPFAGFHIDTS